MASNLTAIQLRVLEALRRRADSGEPPPTYRDLCSEFGWASTATARDHLRALTQKGYLDRSGAGGHRSLRIKSYRAAAVAVPVVGHVTAGVPTPAEQSGEARVAVPADWIRAGTHFAVLVAGESMQGAGILDGDHVVVRHQQTANDGDIVVATIDGETTLKRLRLRGNRAILVAENPNFRPIDIRTDSAVVQGVVIGLLRHYAPSSASIENGRRVLLRRRVRTQRRSHADST
ncbi:MAG: repressor LexA [Candidatus Rokubacteria bacterium]|nr:repressor LexA [Candidatus Rokubacteria bacterium]